MSKVQRLDQTGVTIVELLIALILTAAVFTVIIDFSIDKLADSAKQNIKYQLLTNAETGLNRVANDIRLATSADDNNRWEDTYAPGAPSDLLSWQSNTSTLILAIAAVDSSNNVIFDDAHDYVSAKNNVIYYVSNGTLYRRTLAAPNTGNTAVTTCPPARATTSCPADRDILDNVTSFSLQYYGSDGTTTTPTNAHSVQLNVTLLQHKYRQDISVQYSTRMVFRNG